VKRPSPNLQLTVPPLPKGEGCFPKNSGPVLETAVFPKNSAPLPVGEGVPTCRDG
jgi:hypothetical protein